MEIYIAFQLHYWLFALENFLKTLFPSTNVSGSACPKETPFSKIMSQIYMHLDEVLWHK